MYDVGFVGMATVQGTPNIMVIKTIGKSWFTSSRVVDEYFHYNDEVTDIRPLVVLDPEKAPKDEGCLLDWVLSEWDRQLTKEPPFMSVVSASLYKGGPNMKFIRFSDLNKDGKRWVSRTGINYSWKDLIDPVVVEPWES